VELGVATLVPLETERGVAQPSDAVLERLRRAVAEASKQCGRNRLLEVRPAQSWKSLIIAPDDDRLRLLAHPGGTPLQNAWPGNATKTPAQSIITAIGPEGGFSEDEAGAALNAGWQTVDLGPRILRVETAAIAVAAWAAFSH
jgi:16S rRNA (uracil1498-N3)-methyltransferase